MEPKDDREGEMLDAKTYLSRLTRLHVIIEQNVLELNALFSAHAVQYDKERIKSTTPPDSRTVEVVSKAVELEERIRQDIDEYNEERRHIIRQIQEMPNLNHVRVLYARYVQLKSFDDIARELAYSYKYVIELHSNALREFERLYLDAMGMGNDSQS